LLWEEYEPLVEALREVSPKKIKDPKQAAVSLRRYSRNKLSSVHYELKRTMGDELENTEAVWLDKAYFDDLQNAGETAKLDALSVEILKETASYVKGYINYMLARFAEIDSES
jgi:hypothetical protein